jgi:hypothetical protein
MNRKAKEHIEIDNPILIKFIEYKYETNNSKVKQNRIKYYISLNDISK